VNRKAQGKPHPEAGDYQGCCPCVLVDSPQLDFLRILSPLSGLRACISEDKYLSYSRSNASALTIYVNAIVHAPLPSSRRFAWAELEFLRARTGEL